MIGQELSKSNACGHHVRPWSVYTDPAVMGTILQEEAGSSNLLDVNRRSE